MIIPSIDLMGGSTVQLVQGREKKLDAGDPRPIAQRFGLVGEIAVIDLDAALGKGSNAELLSDLMPLARCRVGGGIRDFDAARKWLDLGAAKIILGTAAQPDLLRRLPRERVIAALDAYDGEVVTHGWRTRTGASIADRMADLRDLVSGFLVTFIETEGTMGGFKMDRALALKKQAGDASLTVAGGVADVSQIAALDKEGIDAQSGKALFTGRFSLADAVGACLSSDRPDGLWPTVVTDEHGVALGLTYSNLASLRAALDERRGVYHSRTRGLWRKGDTSGNIQDLLRVDPDCDRDTLRFVVRQTGPFCHTGASSCFGSAWGLTALDARLRTLAANPAPSSYTTRLLNEPSLLASKLREEADELAAANSACTVAAEAADLLYFTLVRLAGSGVPLDAVARELDRRALRVSRRHGDAKPACAAPTEHR
jgi:phosphoribosyl-AMP cyclohydrolase / phosphoribosyl-ATP pyrophosphohydrolase